ncbi:hypothetical protein, partial [Mesorhizobium sp.]|uniref:hypothetical protein n=1 Tax=Mesorhizobium sp. TaxID=1871066 RepID=UPI0032AF7606
YRSDDLSMRVSYREGAHSAYEVNVTPSLYVPELGILRPVHIYRERHGGACGNGGLATLVESSIQ